MGGRGISKGVGSVGWGVPQHPGWQEACLLGWGQNRSFHSVKYYKMFQQKHGLLFGLMLIVRREEEVLHVIYLFDFRDP